MTITIKTEQLIKVVRFMAWLTFIKLCVQAGGFLFNTFYVLAINEIGAHKFWNELDLSNLLEHSKSDFITLTSLMIIVSTLKALLFYLTVKVFYDKKLNLNRAFAPGLERYLENSAYVCFGIAIFAGWGSKICSWVSSKQVTIPAIQDLGFGGADIWPLMALFIFLFAQLFKRGVQLQTENDLTV
jgi:hypothetical protein